MKESVGNAPITAIVLAAGVNRRLGETKLPKPLMSLTGETDGPSFLERHVDLLRLKEVDDIVVVHSGTVSKLSLAARLVLNPFDTSVTGSTLSLLCAMRLADIPQDHDLLIMDADTVYEQSLLDRVLEVRNKNALFVIDRIAGDAEEVRVYGSKFNSPLLIGKGLSEPITKGMSLFGESIGMIHVSADDRVFVQSLGEWIAGWPPARWGFGYSKERSEHEEIWQYLFSSRRMEIALLPSDLLFAECDTSEDYERITRSVFPAILDREMGSAGAGTKTD